jgi:hypothetical protein
MVVLVLLVLIGCAVFECGSSVDVTAPADVVALFHFIMGDPEITDWGAQYATGNTYVMVNIPVWGALQVSYGIVDGGTFDIFLETT